MQENATLSDFKLYHYISKILKIIVIRSCMNFVIFKQNQYF